MKSYTVPFGQAGQRLDKYLMRLLPGAPYSLVRKLLRKKAVKLNGTRAKGAELLQENDEIRIFLSEERIADLTRGQEEPAWDAFRQQCRRVLSVIGSSMRPHAVLYEDEDILVVDKPFGILSQKGAEADLSMNEWLIARLWEEAGGESTQGRAYFNSLQSFRPSVCNRLDRNTGGLLLCGKTLQGSRLLTELLRKRELQKFYMAVVDGEMTGEGLWKDYLRRDPLTRRVSTVTEEETDSAVEACTRYRVLRTGAGRSLVEAELLTGRTHQIRAQFAAHGHPLLGDIKYGGPPLQRNSGRAGSFPNPDRLSSLKPLPGQYLYCCRLVFPSEGERAELLPAALRGRELRAEPPSAFARALKGK